MDYDEYGWIKASEYRERVLRSLAPKPKPPKEISEETGYYLSHVSNTLSKLQDHELVTCITPDRRKGRLYTPTEKGFEMIVLLEK